MYMHVNERDESAQITRLSPQLNFFKLALFLDGKGGEEGETEKWPRRVRVRVTQAREDPRGTDKHVTSEIMSETEIISVIMAVIALVELLCCR